MDAILDSKTKRAAVAYNTPTPTVIKQVDAEDADMIKQIMKARQAAKAQEKLAKALTEQLMAKHGEDGLNIVLKTSRRVLAWFSWVKQSVRWQEEQVIPAGWKLGKASHSRFYPRDPSAKVKDEAIVKAIEAIENEI